MSRIRSWMISGLEADKRLKAYRGGTLEGIPMEEIFKEE